MARCQMTYKGFDIQRHQVGSNVCWQIYKDAKFFECCTLRRYAKQRIDFCVDRGLWV